MGLEEAIHFVSPVMHCEFSFFFMATLWCCFCFCGNGIILCGGKLGDTALPWVWKKLHILCLLWCIMNFLFLQFHGYIVMLFLFLWKWYHSLWGWVWRWVVESANRNAMLCLVLCCIRVKITLLFPCDSIIGSLLLRWWCLHFFVLFWVLC